MSYLRFLTDKDYNCIATEEHMRQLIREIPERVPQAEQRAEMQMLEYLDQYYEIEKALAVGKNIREYNAMVTYPPRVHIKKDEDIFKTLTGINGHKRPTKKVYWKQVVDFIDPYLTEHAKKYSQLRMYEKGEVVRFGTEYWQCLIPHGYEAGEIHMPGIKVWEEAEVTDWEPNMDWERFQVCKFEDNFYVYLGNPDKDDEEGGEVVDPAEPVEPIRPKPEGPPLPDETEDPDPSLSEEEDNDISTQSEEPEELGEGEESPEEPEEGDKDPSDGEDESEEPIASEEVLTPEEDDDWGLIGEYSDEYRYSWETEDDTPPDYVVAEDTVFYPVLNPNADELVEGVNITRDDPRNQNVVAHLSRIALYHLHSIIAPTNVPETRRWAYEDSVQWLYNASKFKINPQIPRKREHDSCRPKVDWACATFQRDYDPNENMWLI